MHCVSVGIDTVHGADGVTLATLALAIAGIISTAQLLEGSDDVLLADFKSNCRTTDELIDSLREVPHHRLI